jgi:alanine racemase
MTDGTGLPAQPAATGGILLGRRYHFDLTRPGIGLYGGAPLRRRARSLTLSLPVIQSARSIPAKRSATAAPGSPTASPPHRHLAAGYADGLAAHPVATGRSSGMATCPALWSAASRWT